MRKWTMLGISLSLIACVSGPYEASPGGTAPSEAPQASMARIRVVHGSPDAPAVDVYIKGQALPAITNLSYGSSSATAMVPPGNYAFEIRASPSKATDAVVFETATLPLAAGQRVTAIAAGTLAGKGDAAFRVLPIAEAFGAAAEGKARATVVHAGADAPTVALDVGDDDSSKPEVRDLPRFASTAAEGAVLPAGQSLQLGILAGGRRVTGFTLPALPNRGNVLVIATGLLGKPSREASGFGLLAVTDDDQAFHIRQNPVVYALHASIDAPAIDAFAGEAKVLSGLSFGNLSQALQVPPGNARLELYAQSADPRKPLTPPAAIVQTGELQAGERYLTIASGLLAPTGSLPALSLVTVREGFDAPGADAARVRVVHDAPEVGSIDVGPATGTTVPTAIFKELSFGKSSADAGSDLPASPTLIGIAPSGRTNALLRLTLSPAAGSRAFAVAAGSVAAGSARPFRLMVVDTTGPAWAISHVFPH